MTRNLILSIDWDHTLRNLSGLDINILSLIAYANSRQIPVGLTTHRDIENTTLYTLHYWQYEKPKAESTALAAAISYWNTRFFDPLNIKIDFINARYQPLYNKSNYYNQVLLPHENCLANDIIVKGILQDSNRVRDAIKNYALQKEPAFENNEHKEAQISWLGNRYAREFDKIVIYHIDDDKELCEALPKKIKQMTATNENIAVKIVPYCIMPLFANKESLPLLQDIGLMDDIELFLNHCNSSMIPFADNPSRCLSVCLCLLQMYDSEQSILSLIKKTIDRIKPQLKGAILNFIQLIENIIKIVQLSKHPVYLLSNDLYPLHMNSRHCKEASLGMTNF
ncbi:MAG: hypothetical protein WBE18_07685 [Gammaproteobacteria bacterium]